jgi:phospholipid/cholesterol/gamma-HCH transport system substrate-binding protein
MAKRTFVSVAVVAVFASACLAILWFIAMNMGLRGPWTRQVTLRADFQSANGLVTDAEVRVSGVHVGNVTGISGSRDGGSIVTMALQSDVRLRRDTRAVIRPKTLLGEKFVELVRTPDSSAGYLSDDSLIPRSQTGQAIEIDDILNAMDAPTRQAMSESFRQLGIALDNRQQDLANSLLPLDQTMTNLRPLARVGENRQQQLDHILTNLNIIMQALADEQDQLGQIIDKGDVVMSAIASRDQALAGTVKNGAAVFSSLDQAFSGVTAADRSSLQKSPPTIAAGRRTLALTNPQVDQLIPELLLAQVTYPNDQLNISDAESITLAKEWISAFSQQCGVPATNCLRIVGNPLLAAQPPGVPLQAPAAPGSLPAAPSTLSDLLLQTLGGPHK